MQEERMDAIKTSNESEFVTKGIVQLFTKYAGLAFIGLLAQGIMVILEGIFIGNGLGTKGLAVVGFLMPLEYFQLALHGCFGIGISTICAERLGKGDRDGAKKAYTDGMWFSIYLILAIVVLIEIFAPQIASFVGCTSDLMDVTIPAIRVFVIFWPFSMIGQIATYMIRVAEQPKIASIVVTLAAVVAIIWLCLSIFVLGIGLPVGVAIYYGISIGLFALVLPFLQKRSYFKLQVSNMKVGMKNVKKIVKIGFPYLLVQGSTSIFGVVVNNLLGNELDIAAYAVLNGYIIYMLMMIQQAATQGMQPIASFNYGAGINQRVKKLLRVSIFGNNIAVYILALIFLIFSKQVCGILCGYDEALTPVVMKYNVMFCIVSGIGFTADMLSGYFQSVERITFATILGLARYIIFGIPCMFIFKAIMGAEGVWYGQGVSYILAFILAMILVIYENKRLSEK